MASKKGVSSTRNVGRGTDDTLFALQAGSVKFGSRRGRRVVDIVPAE